MSTIAIAGATGKIGRTLIDVLSNNSQRQIIALSRSTISESRPNVRSHAVDYSDVAGLQGLLERNKVQSVISTLQVNSDESGLSERNLVQAAAQSTCTNRFIASEWAMPIEDKSLQLPFSAHRAATVEYLKKTTLEFTTINVGIIADHLGTPHLQSYLGGYALHIDMQNCAASVPGNGDDLVSFVYSYDIARFVDALLSQPRWEPESFCYSDTRTYAQVVAAAEKARGAKFSITYDNVESLEKGQMTPLPCHRDHPMKDILRFRWSIFGLYAAKALLYIPYENSLNQMFPDVKITTIEDIVGAWRGK